MNLRSTAIVWGFFLAIVIMIAVGIAVVPQFIEDAYNGHAHPWLNALIHGKESNSIQHYIDIWFRLLSWTSALLLVAAGALVAGFRRAGTYFSSYVYGESALAIPILRAVVFFALGMNILWEDLPSVVHLPSEVRSEMGVMRILHLAPMWDKVYGSAVVLWFIKLLGAISCLLAMVGVWSRVTIPVGAVLAILHGGILREFSHLFHTCLLPIYLACAFALMGFANMRRSKLGLFQKKGGVTRMSMEIGAWSYHYCLALIAISYTLAGWSKIWGGGWGWWKGVNLKRIVMSDTLGPMHFEWGLDSTLAVLPLWFYSIVGLFALAVECLYGLVLVSRTARIIVPTLAITLHGGIWLAQGILFFDLILLQIAIIAIEFHRRTVVARDLNGKGGDQQEIQAFEPQTHRRCFSFLVLTTLFLVGVWRAGVEQFPLTGWRMYSGFRDDGWVDYREIYSVSAAGVREKALVDQWIGAMADTRYRDMLHKSKDQQQVFFDAVGRRANDLQHVQQSGGDEIVAFEVERKRWNFLTDPNNQEFGQVWEMNRFSVQK